MKILTVIHGYPSYYMAGSEVYTYNLCNELAKNNEIEVFSRYENPYEEQYQLLVEMINGIKVTRVNKSSRNYTFEEKYLDVEVDRLFEKKLEEFKPDVVYIGHLSHLSTNIPIIAKSKGIPIVFTIHDFWMFCYRGQLISSSGNICSNPSKEKCFECMKHTYKTYVKEEDVDIYNNHIAKVIDSIDIFLAPSKVVYDFFIDNAVASSKIVFSKYGFDTSKIKYQKKFYTNLSSNLKFGFMGRVIPVKGMKTLFEAFKDAPNAKLTIYGSQADKKYLDLYSVQNVHYHGAYHNDDINKVLEDMDVLIVPSIWAENSPLVIQEAFLAGIPVITSDFGGMKELVEHNKDGFLFPLGDSKKLSKLINDICDNPEILNQVRGNPKKVRSIEDDARFIEEKMLLLSSGYQDRFPWRVTFDTNPEICNLKCEMCEEHSIYNKNRPNKKSPTMDIGIVEKIIKEGVGKGLKEIIPSTMGEPLMYEDFDKIIELCKANGIKLNLTTNGTFPKKSLEQWAEILLPVCSDIKISQNQWIDASEPFIMSGTSPIKTYNAVLTLLEKRKELINKGISCSTITIQVTFMKKNLSDIYEIIKNYDEIGVDRIKGHHLWITWPELKEQSLRGSEKLWNKYTKEYKSVAKNVKLQNFEELGEAKNNKNLDTYCPFLGREAWIAKDGTFNVCCAPDKQRKEFGYFGNVNTSSLGDLWSSNQYKSFVKDYHQNSLCQSCTMKIIK